MESHQEALSASYTWVLPKEACAPQHTNTCRSGHWSAHFCTSECYASFFMRSNHIPERRRSRRRKIKFTRRKVNKPCLPCTVCGTGLLMNCFIIKASCKNVWKMYCCRKIHVDFSFDRKTRVPRQEGWSKIWRVEAAELIDHWIAEIWSSSISMYFLSLEMLIPIYKTYTSQLY